MECNIHPGRPAVALCEKFGVAYCKDCCEDEGTPQACGCSSPQAHCPFRSRCLVWEMSRKRRKERRDSSMEGGLPCQRE